MTRPKEDGEDLDDDVLDRALDGGFAAAGDAAASVVESVGAITGHVPRLSLRDADPASDTPVPEPPGPDDARQAGKYVVQGELGTGGIGAVHRGHDRELGRDVAMKFLREKYRDHPDILHRFVEEAQIGGQLQHPGIVPVYDLGMSDGKPFFTMKLVEGRTLASLLADRTAPATDRRRFLTIFHQVCQTVAYAHARGVVHRDLKPANIMIGAFGEVQVVDWGMGKVLQGSSGEAASAQEGTARAIATVRSSGEGTESLMGSVMGTPAYMPPEQARGQVDRMDERSDVFALGAILCEILTGQPAYAGPQRELITMAARAKQDDAHARLARSDVDEDLLELTRRCLMPSPADRPESAAAVAESIQENLASAEQRAHDANVRAAALERTQKLGVALLAVIALGLAATLWFWSAARTNLANFDRLSYVVKLEDAKAKEKQLYPATPDKTGAMRAWLEGDAKELRDALVHLRATLAVLEARAFPQPDAEVAAARRSHPRAPRLGRLRRKLESLQRAQDVRSGAAEPDRFGLDAITAAKTAFQLHDLAWPLVDPERDVFGREAEGLALARRAVAVVPARGRGPAIVRNALAWALVANGLDEEAVAESRAALAAAGPRRKEYEGHLARIKSVIGAAADRLARVRAEVRGLETEVSRQLDFEFADDGDAFLHTTLRRLIADIEAFDSTTVRDVEQRLAWAERVDDLTVARHRARWTEAKRAIRRADGVTASKLYAEVPIELSPQLGLVPIGMNPKSKLWEFHHVRSAWDAAGGSDPAQLQTPEHAEDGGLRTHGLGIVFVLIPGGRFYMGAQHRDPGGPNFDARSRRGEAPVREVRLAPFFLARHEMTQGQWARLTDGAYPSLLKIGRRYRGNGPVPVGETHPVENVSWQQCDELLRAHGLSLPTEAQWEYGCRGRKPTPWFTGREPGSLEGFANVLDRTGETVGSLWPGGEAFDDGYKVQAPVGTFGANPFGLHDVHGNVWEWCRDWHGGYSLPGRRGDGLREPGPAADHRCCRGGSFRFAAHLARSAIRYPTAPTIASGEIGVRPARVVVAVPR